MWWNNPVNDDHDAWLYMREMTAHWTIEDVNPIPTLHGLMMNPMSQSEVSKVFLFGAADYSWNPAKFNTYTNWEASFSTIIRDDKKMEDALKTFALNVDPNIESENLIQLYAAFKANYSENNLPTVTNDLLAEMTKINEACTLLLTLKDSDNEDYKALYEDIRCWVFKLKSMSGIVCSSLNLMKSKGQLDAWTDYQKVKEEYKKLHTDDLFRVIAFEDAGESTYEKKYDVEPSGKYMLPFIDYLMGKIDAYAPL
ncbi:MAG: beta-N-acetylglucosaminidase domain-containing protein, partial [Bacteroides sp.]